MGGLLIDADRETKHRALERALSAGINWIDTAPSYGQGRSESALGELLPTLPHDPHVSTKFAIDTRDLSDLAGQIEASLEQSLRRLRRDSVTLLQTTGSAPRPQAACSAWTGSSSPAAWSTCSKDSVGRD